MCSARGLKGRLGAANRRMLSLALAERPAAGGVAPFPFVVAAGIVRNVKEMAGLEEGDG